MPELEFDANKIKRVPISQIQANPWNPKLPGTDEYKKIVNSIKANNLQGYIDVREIAKDKYEIMDGEQRWTAATELGFDEMYIYNHGEVSDRDAKSFTIWWQVQNPFDAIKEAKLVSQMVIEYKGDVALPYTEEEMIEMKEIADFDFDQYNKKGEGGEEMIHITFHYDKARGTEIMQKLKSIDDDKEIALYSLVTGG